jgi:nicotinamidase-related amidase
MSVDTEEARFKPALLVVDFQNDFCPKPNPDGKDGALVVAGGRDILEPVNDLLSLPFALKVATQDWHPPDHCSFVGHGGGWPVHCVQGSDGANLVDGLALDKFDLTIKKGRNKDCEMYSAFYDDNHNEDSGLADKLREAEITDVYVVGLAADYCVKCTALHAAEVGFKTVVVEEATRAVYPTTSNWQRSLRESEFKVEVVNMGGHHVQKVHQMPSRT